MDKTYCSLPANIGIRNRLAILAIKEKRTLTGELEFILDDYEKKINLKCTQIEHMCINQSE